MNNWQKQLLEGSTGVQWSRIGVRPHVGIALPLSALHSHNSCGIGEFLDLIPLIDWCVDLGMDVIQLLPLNDSGLDPSPYNALSSCALHPIYLSLHKLPGIDISELSSLNMSFHIAFPTVYARKHHLLTEYFNREGQAIIDSVEFKKFEKMTPWLDAYALFKVLQQEMNHIPLNAWPDDYKYTTARTREALLKEYIQEVSFHKVLQYLCFTQLQEVHAYALKKKVLLKGDIPILISPNSADVWQYPEFFNLDLSAGAPPDQYCKQGQNWGFPLFQWVILKKHNFSWWAQRLSYASHFYDLYRIDHAVGLFRIWGIPLDMPSEEGHFVPADEHVWGPHGTEILEALVHFSPMLPMAEDLGTIPPVVRPILEHFGIPGTKVMRWERDWQGDQSFLDPSTYSKISLTCLSTHDSPTLEQWWRDFPEEASVYAKQNGWTYNQKITQEQRERLLQESLSSNSLFHINLLGEYLALMPEFISTNPDEERINIPGTILPTNWTYKFRKSIEEMVSDPILSEKIKKILSLGKKSLSGDTPF